MKVKDLIKILEAHEPDDEVVIEESGYDWKQVVAIYDEGGCRSELLITDTRTE